MSDIKKKNELLIVLPCNTCQDLQKYRLNIKLTKE